MNQTIAKKIVDHCVKSFEVDAIAQWHKPKIIQDWDNERTIYNFSDDSVLIVSSTDFYELK